MRLLLSDHRNISPIPRCLTVSVIFGSYYQLRPIHHSKTLHSLGIREKPVLGRFREFFFLFRVHLSLDLTQVQTSPCQWSSGVDVFAESSVHRKNAMIVYTWCTRCACDVEGERERKFDLIFSGTWCHYRWSVEGGK